MAIRIEAPRNDHQTRIADCALTSLGTPFRLQGRSLDYGLDCIGVAALCLSAAGLQFEVPANYRVRGDFEERADAFFAASKFQSVDDACWVAGDILLLRPGARQIHLAVLTLQGAVHAHMGLGRVVLTPLPLPFAQIAQWRFQGD